MQEDNDWIEDFRRMHGWLDHSNQHIHNHVAERYYPPIPVLLCAIAISGVFICGVIYIVEAIF